MCCFSLARMATKGRSVQPALLGLMTRIWVTTVTVVHCYTAPMILNRAVTRSTPEELLKCPDLWCAPRCPGRAVGAPPVLSAEPSSSLTVLLHRALQTPLAARRPKPLLVMKPAHACDLYSVRNTRPSLRLDEQRPQCLASWVLGRFHSSHPVSKMPLSTDK